jgi:hypothetical protein
LWTLYRHRVNTLTQLEETPADQGIEFDLRSDGDDVLVTHDPFTKGPRIEEFFPLIGKRPCIFNVKTEGIEARVLELAAKHAIEEFFFLDLSVPAAVKLVRSGETRIAVRWSEWEPLAGVVAWKDRAQWVWVDCFQTWPGDAEEWERLAKDFRLCLVSPELQGRGVEAIARERALVAGRPFHAVCSKRPDLWTAAP